MILYNLIYVSIYTRKKRKAASLLFLIASYLHNTSIHVLRFGICKFVFQFFYKWILNMFTSISYYETHSLRNMLWVFGFKCLIWLANQQIKVDQLIDHIIVTFSLSDSQSMKICTNDFYEISHIPTPIQPNICLVPESSSLEVFCYIIYWILSCCVLYIGVKSTIWKKIWLGLFTIFLKNFFIWKQMCGCYRVAVSLNNISISFWLSQRLKFNIYGDKIKLLVKMHFFLFNQQVPWLVEY